jgi:transcriptional repressor NrdR
MKCPFCGFLEDRVIDSREREDGFQIRRRRECFGCGKRFTTYEEIEENALIVIKSDGRREKFSREKVFNGIQKACEKRPISIEQISGIVDGIEQELRQKFESEVSSKEIGRLVMKNLKKLDEIAYVRFASVYREFKDITEFQKEVEQILGGKSGKSERKQ